MNIQKAPKTSHIYYVNITKNTHRTHMYMYVHHSDLSMVTFMNSCSGHGMPLYMTSGVTRSSTIRAMIFAM